MDANLPEVQEALQQMNPCGISSKANDGDPPTEAVVKRMKQLRMTAEGLAALLTDGITFISNDGRRVVTVEGLPDDARITNVEWLKAEAVIVLTVESERFIDDAPMDVEMRSRPIANLVMPDGIGKES